MRKTILLFMFLVFVNGLRAQELKHENCDSAETQDEINWCVGNNYRIAEGVMDSVYDAFLAHVGYLRDSGVPDTTDPIIGARRALVQSQKAWLDYRENATKLIKSYFGTGSMANAEAWTYKTKLTLDRIRELELLQSFWNGTKPSAINPNWHLR